MFFAGAHVTRRKPVVMHHLYHLPVSLPLLLLLPPSVAPLLLCAVGVDLPWCWSRDIKGSAVTSWWLWFHVGPPRSPPWRLAWASLLSLFTSRLSRRLSGQVLRLSPRPHVSSFVRLLSLPFWLSTQSSLIRSVDCWSGRDPALATSGKKETNISKINWETTHSFCKSTNNRKGLFIFLWTVGFTTLQRNICFYVYDPILKW